MAICTPASALSKGATAAITGVEECQTNQRLIEERPAIVEWRSRIGNDWDLDTIIGKGHSGVLVPLTKQKSRLARLKKHRIGYFLSTPVALVS